MLIKSFKIILALLTCFWINNLSSCSTLETKAWIEQERKKVNKLIFDNGLTVLHYYKSDTPEVILLMNIKVGSKDEKPHQSGFAHFLEHMVFKGTNEDEESPSETDVKEIAERYCAGNIGEGFNAHTSYDNTLYSFNSDKNNWPVFLKILKGWLLHAKLDPEHFASEIKTVYEESQSKPSEALETLFSHVLPSTHPYFYPVIGNMETLLKSTVEDLRAFYKEQYVPEKTAIIIGGNVKKEEVIKNISKTFKTHLKSENVNPEVKSSKEYHYTRFSKHSFTVSTYHPPYNTSLIWPVPGIYGTNVHALMVISNILTKRLQQILIDKLEYVTNIHANFIGYELQSIFNVSYEINENINETNIEEKCKKVILEEINKIQTEGFKQEELEFYQQEKLLKIFIDSEELENICKELAGNHQGNYTLEDLFSDSEKFLNLTLNDLQEAVKEYLITPYMNVMRVTNFSEEEMQKWIQAHQQCTQEVRELLSKFKRDNPVEGPLYANKLPAPKLLNFEFEAPSKILTLSNGMKAFVKKKDHVPFIALKMNKYDHKTSLNNHALEGKGVAHFLSQQLLRIGNSKEEMNQFLNEYGIMGNPTDFYCSKTHFETIVKKFVDVILNAEFPEKYIKENISFQKDCLTQSLQSPSGIAQERFAEIFLKLYPWNIPNGEVLKTCDSCTREQILDIHQEFISDPEMIFLVVVGDFNEDTIQETLERAFIKWQKKRALEYKEIEIPQIENPTPQTITQYFPSEGVYLLFGRITVEAYSRDWFALSLLNHFLNKKLFNIRERTGLFYSCEAALTNRGDRELKDYAQIETHVSDSSNLNKTKEEIKTALQSFITNEISDEELTSRKHYYLTYLAKAFASTNQAIANAYVEVVGANKTWCFFNEFLNSIYSITVEDIKNVAKKYLNPDEWTIIQVGNIVNE